MFESIVASLLQKYVGKYISNLDSSNLDISIFKGDIELTDLQLRPEALTELNLPVEVKAGHVGHLKIDIPVTQLFTADIHVAIENVFILAGPIIDRNYNPEKEQQFENAIKRHLLESIEESALEGVVQKATDNPTLLEKLSTNLLNRLQVSVRHIHVRYEDTITNGDHAFACGLMLKQLLLCSTDSHWQPKGGDVTANMMHKMLKMEDLSVYWNPYVPEQHLLRSRLNTDGWKNVLRMSIDSHTIFEEELDFIVEPVAAQAKLIVNSDNSFTLPKFFMDFTVEEVEVLLSRQQFLNMISLSDSFQLMRVNQRYRKYHPNVNLRESPSLWWTYAYTAILEEFIRPYSWTRIKQHRIKYKKYRSLYKKFLGAPDNKALAEKLKELENSLDVTNILIAREEAKLEFAREAPERAKKTTKKKSGWFSSWLWGEDEEEVVVEVDSLDGRNWLSNLTAEEKEKLYGGIGYNENTVSEAYPKKYVALKIQVILKRCCLSLVNYSKKILQVSVTHLLSTYEYRPSGAFRISSNTESFAIDGASIEHELIPVLTSDIGVYAPALNQVFTLDFESKPLYVDADYSLSLNVQPVEIVYDEHSISEVAAFFQLPQGGLDLKAAAVQTLTSVATVSRTGLQYAIQNHTTVHVALNMRSPYIVIPEFGTLHRGGNVLIIDLGILRIESELQPRDVSLEDATMSEIESRLYDQFSVKITDVKVLLADSADDWHTAQIQQNSEYHILPSVQLILTFFTAVKPDFTQLPRHKVDAKVPSVEINISDKRMLLMATFFQNFPIPTSSSMATIGEDLVDGHGGSFPTPLHVDACEVQLDPDVNMLRCIRGHVLGRPLVDRKGSLRQSTSKVPTLMYTKGDEPFYSASDYSDEDLEQLSDMLTIKPVDDNASVANTINVLMRMSLGELLINLSKEMDKEEKAYLMLRVDRLRIDSALTVHGFSAYATLGGIQLIDKIHVGHSGEYMEVLSMNIHSNSNLVSIMFRQVEPSCPDFSTYYGGIEHAVKIKVLSMSVLFDQSSMMYLNAFVQSLLSSLQNLDMKTSTSSVMTTSDIGTKDKVNITKKIVNISEQANDMPGNSTKLNLVAEMADLCIRLTDADNSLAEIKVKGFEGSIVSKPTKTIFRSRLKDVSVKDCSAGAIYKNILLLQDDSLFDLKLVKYNKSHKSSKDSSASQRALDYSLRLRLGQIHAAVLGKFYWEITRFLEPFISQEMAEVAKQAAVETVKKQEVVVRADHSVQDIFFSVGQVNAVESQSLRINIDLDLRAPILLLPHDSKSTEMFLVQLGNLSVRNSFLQTSVSQDAQQEWNLVHISLSQVQVQRVFLNVTEDTTEILHTVLEPLSFKMDVKLAIEPVVTDVKLDISGQLQKVKIYILQKDLQLFLGVMKYNLTEGSPPPSPGIFESPTLQNIQSQPQPGPGDLDSPSPDHEQITPESPPEFTPKNATSVAFQLEGMSVTLFTDNGKELATKTSLSLLDLEKIRVSAVSESDGDIQVEVSLHMLSLDDTRPDSDLADKRIISCKQKLDTAEDTPLVSVHYKMTSDGNHKADLLVEKLCFHVYIPYMMVLMEFFSGAVETVTQSSSMLPDSVPGSRPQGLPGAPLNLTGEDSEQASGPALSKLTIYGKLKQPEVSLYADPSKVDSRRIILHSDVVFEFCKAFTDQTIWLKVTDLKLMSHGKEHSKTSTLVMVPCCIELTHKSEYLSSATDIKISVSTVQVFLSSSLMQILWDVSSMLQKQTVTADQDQTKAAVDPDVQNLWDVTKVTSDKWLKDKADSNKSLPNLHPAQQPRESLQLDIKDINIFFEIETLDMRVPIVCLHTSIEAKVQEWSQKMHVESEFHLKAMFYNEKMSVWEPLIEPVMDKEGLYRPWELLVKIMKARTFPMICMYEEKDLTISEELQTEVQQMMHRNRGKSSSSETDETDNDVDMTVIKHKSLRRLRCASDRSFGSGTGFDEIDGALGEGDDQEGENSCLYVLVDSTDKLQLNITPQAIAVLKDVVHAITNPSQSELESVRSKPRFKVNNQLGLHAYITCHSNIKIHKTEMKHATIYHADGGESIVHPADYTNDIEVETESNSGTQDSDDKHSVNSALAQAGYALASSGAFLFDAEDNCLSSHEIDKYRLKLQVEGFEQTHSILHKRECRRIIPLAPIKNGMRYSVVMEVDIEHGLKTVHFHSPVTLENQLTMPIDIYCRTEDLKKFKATKALAGAETYSKLACVEPHKNYHLPLFVAYHCPVFVKPSDISYELTTTGLWWQDMLQGKDRVKNFFCMSSYDEKKSFNFKVVCREGQELKPPQVVPRAVPYYTISLYPPVILHNYLPYDIQFSLQGTAMSSSLTHGETTPLYTVETNKCYKLQITLADYMGSDWQGSLDISPDMEEFRAICMETEVDSEHINRHLSLSIHADQSTSLDLQIYAPYWIINKTDLPLQFRGSLSEAVYEFGNTPNPLLFRFKKHKKKKAKLRVYESRWSQSFSTDTVGNSGVVICNDKERGKKYMFMIDITLSKLHLTKLVTVMPFFLVVNNSKHKLRYMEENEYADLWVDIEPAQYQPYWPVTESFNMYVKFDGSNVSSLHFPIKSCHNTVLRMEQGKAICVEVVGGTDTPITIIFTDYEHGDAPVRVENLCEDVFIKIHQKNQSQVTLLSPYQSILYTWDEPSAERTLMWNVYGRKKPSYPAYISKDGSGEIRLSVPSLRSASSNTAVDLTDAMNTDDSSSPDDESDETDGLVVISDRQLLGHTRVDKMVVFWISYLDGLQRVLLFTQDERVAKAVRKINEGESARLAVFASLEGVSLSLVNSLYQEVALVTVSSCPTVWEVEVKEKLRPLSMELAAWLEDQWRGDVAGAKLHDQIEADLRNMQMTKPFMGALKRTLHPGVWCQYRKSDHHMAVNVSLQTLQVDNQLPDAYFPTVVSPAPLPAYVVRRMGHKPFIEAGLMRRTVQEQNINTVRYAKILVQEFNLKVDKGFIVSLMDVATQLIPPVKESFQLQCDLYQARQSLKETIAKLIASRPQKIFFEYIHLSPLKLHLSFSLFDKPHISPRHPGKVQPNSMTADVLDFFLNSVGVTLTEIKDVELRMAYFERKGVLLSANQLMAQVQSHYTHQILQQAYVLILGLDVLGNPYGLIKDFTQGLGDFFYEPFLGSIQGRDEFIDHLTRGVESLFGNTIGGTAGSIAQITGGIGRAIAVLSFDEDYRRKRRTRMQQEPQSLPASLALASKTLVMGISLGLSGVILDPVKGAHEDGVEGFFKGVGKGLLGLLSKPAGGVVDMVSMAFDGLRRTAEMENSVVARIRLPRFINPNLGLRPYSPYMAAGLRLLQTILKGELAKTDIYWAHAALSREEKANIVLITDRNILMLEKSRFWSSWSVDWQVPVENILGVPVLIDNKLIFKIKEDDLSVNLFASRDKEIVGETDILHWLQQQFRLLVQYIAQ